MSRRTFRTHDAIEDYVKRQKKRLSRVPPHIVTGAKLPKTILVERMATEAALHVFDEHAFQSLASWTCEGPEIKSRFIRLDVRKIHLPAAFWAPGAIIQDRGFGRIFEL
jgi:hypothetical protein